MIFMFLKFVQIYELGRPDLPFHTLGPLFVPTFELLISETINNTYYGLHR